MSMHTDREYEQRIKILERKLKFAEEELESLQEDREELIIEAMEKMYSILEGVPLEAWQKEDIRNYYYKEFLDERRLRKQNEGKLRE